MITSFFSRQRRVDDLLRWLITGGVFYAYNSTLDVAFLFDGTFTSSEWSIIRQFMEDFSDRFYIGQTMTRFAVVQYSQSQSLTFGFRSYSTNAALRSALSTLQQQSTGNVRNLGDALNYVYSTVFTQARVWAAKVRRLYTVLR